jgi:hypothetical protein
MAASKVMHGARAKVFIADPNTGIPQLIGIFSQISWGLSYDVQPVFILGRMGPDETVYTAQEPVSISCSGFRVVGAGAHRLAKMPNVRDLLTHEYLTISVSDRQSNREIAKFHSVRPVSYSTSLNARNIEEISVNYIGLLVDDEDTVLAERADAAKLP